MITGVKGADPEGSGDALETDPYGRLMDLLREVKAGRVLSAANVTKVDAALGALRDAIDALEALLAAAEPAKGHSALRTAADLRLAMSTHDVLVARARTAGLFDSTHSGYRPGQKPPAGAGHRMSLAISA